MDRRIDFSRAPQRSLIVAFVAVTVGFIAATAYSQYSFESIEQPAEEIATHAAPAIDSLAEARADLGELQVRLYAQIRGVDEGAPLDEAPIKDAQARLAGALDRYDMAAAQARDDVDVHGAAEVDVRIAVSVHDVNEAVEGVLIALRAGDVPSARLVGAGGARHALERASDALRAGTSRSAQHAAELARRIEERRERSMHLAFVLDILCAVAAAVAALVASRVVREYGAVVESRNALLARRAEELETFASRVAHDIVSPLGTIAMALDVVMLRTHDPSVTSMIDRARGATRRTAGVVHDLLAFARSAASPAPDGRCDLREVLDGVIDELSPQACQAHVRLTLGEVPPCGVACAPGVLTSIVSNLVRNAIDYIGERDERTVTLRARERDHRVTVEVSDTGPGIAREMQHVIFLPHVRGTRARRVGVGLGLGLATVKRLVEAHGGAVRVCSEPGRGATFEFELRAAEPSHLAG